MTALIDDDRGDRDGAGDARRAYASAVPGLTSQRRVAHHSSPVRRRLPVAQARPARSVPSAKRPHLPSPRARRARRGRAGDDDHILLRLQLGLDMRERLAQQALDAVALRPRRPPCATPTAPAAAARKRSSGTCTGPGGGWRSSDPGDRRARTLRCATADRARHARGLIACPPGSGLASTRPLGRQALASLVAPALQRQPSGARGHASTETVRASSLALLWLVGALHGGSAV